MIFMGYFSAFDPISDFPQEKMLEHSAPAWYRGGSRKSIVICIHGFTATTYESKPIAEALHKAGFDAACPLMPGHGYKALSEQKRAIGQVSYTEYIDAVEIEIKRARETYSTVYFYGQSMGGALALVAAARGLVEACATTAPAIKLPRGVGFGTALLGWMNASVGITFNPPFYNEAYQFSNLHAVKQIQNLAMYARKKLSQIRCPLLSCHSPDDEAVDPKVVPAMIQKAVPHAEIKWFTGGHTMPLDKDAELVKAAIVSFFQQVR